MANDFFVTLMDAFYDKPYGKSDEQLQVMLGEYISATNGFKHSVQEEAWNRIKITHAKRPPLPDVIKVLNQVQAERPESRPPALPNMSELTCLRTPQGQHALREGSGRAFWLECDKHKRIITPAETDRLVRSENGAKAEKIEFPLTKFGRFLKGVHENMGIAEKNFQDKWANKV